MGKSGSAITFAIVMTGAVMLSGCTKEGPLEPSLLPDVAGDNTISMLKLPALGTLQKWSSVCGDITVKDGGKIVFRYEDKTLGKDKKFKIDIEIKFDKGSVSNDFQASMGLDYTYLMSSVDLEFGPHGTQFLRPATLSVKVEGLDLSMFTEKTNINLYYDEGGSWIPMVGKVTVDPKKGTLECNDGELPHFSRYCFGR